MRRRAKRGGRTRRRAIRSTGRWRRGPAALLTALAAVALSGCGDEGPREPPEPVDEEDTLFGAPPVGDVALVGGEIRPVSGPPIADGAVVVLDGRIEAVGPRAEVEVPEGVRVIEVPDGHVVTPGFIDARTSVALEGGVGDDDSTLIRGPEARMADGLGELDVPGDFGMEARETRAHPWVMDGVTAAYVAPDAENLVAGFGAVVKLAGDRLGTVVDSATALHLTLGEEPTDAFDAPTTRQGMVAVLRQWLHRAADAAPGQAFALGEPATSVEELRVPPEWVANDDLVAVLDGLRPARIWAHSPDDVLAALRLTGEFGLRTVVDGASGAHLVADALAEAPGASIVLGPAIGGPGPASETFALTPESAARLHAAGVPVAFSTDGSGGGRAVTVEAIVARGHGLPADAALRALTLDAARMLGVDDRLGSLEPGKDGDLVVWSGDPVGTWGEARTVVVGGVVVYERGGG